MTCPGCAGDGWTHYNICKPCKFYAVCTCGICLGQRVVVSIVPRKGSARYRAQLELSHILLRDVVLHLNCQKVSDA